MKHLKMTWAMLCSMAMIFNLSSCTDDVTDDLKPNYKFEIQLSSNTVAQFDSLKVNIPPGYYTEVKLRYDSLVWFANGISVDNNRAEEIANMRSGMLRTRTIRDYKLGNQEVVVKAYKNGVVADEAKAQYTVTKPTNDFFTVEWGGESQYKRAIDMGYTPVRLLSGGGSSAVSLVLTSKDAISAALEFDFRVFGFEAAGRSEADASQGTALMNAFNSRATNFDILALGNWWIKDIIAAGDKSKLAPITENTRISIFGLLEEQFGAPELISSSPKSDELSQAFTDRFGYSKDLTKPGHKEPIHVTAIWQTETTDVALLWEEDVWYYAVAQQKGAKLDLPLELIATATTVDQFESFEVSMPLDVFASVQGQYDSLVWFANGLDIASSPRSEDKFIQNGMIRKRFIRDYKIGTHKVAVHAYKNGVKKDEAEVSYTVTKPTGDFFNTSWSKRDKFKYNPDLGYSPIQVRQTEGWNAISLQMNNRTEKYGYRVYLSFAFGTVYGFDMNSIPAEPSVIPPYPGSPAAPYVSNMDILSIGDWWILEYIADPSKNSLAPIIANTRAVLNTLLINEFGQPDQVLGNDEQKSDRLHAEFQKRFGMTKEEANEFGPVSTNVQHVVAMWQTPTSHVALLWEELGWYYAVAVPKVK